MPFKNNPGCSCCEEVDRGCCQTIVVKPLPTRTVNGSVVTYSDTAWDTTYASGISGTDNTVPANTTVTISVPVGCTDYAVDVEVLDDAGQHVTNSSPGLTIKVGDALQASNVNKATDPSVFGYSYSGTFQWPTIFSQHNVATNNRDGVGPSSITRPYYNDYYAAYRFFEIFYAATMESGVVAYGQPPWRSDVSTLQNQSVSSARLPHDAGGLTIAITIETGAYPVEIGLVQVHSGHHSCTTISSLDGIPQGENCPAGVGGATNVAWYTVTDPASYVVNNGSNTQTTSKSGDVQRAGLCADPLCTYTYSSTFNFSQWTGNHNWDLKHYDLAGYFNNSAYTSYQSSGSAASSGLQTSLGTYLGKVANHQWSHSDRLVDWRLFDWVEPELNSATYAISHTLSISGSCNVVAETQANITSDLDAIRDNRVYPSGGPLFMQQNYVDGLPCPEPTYCSGDPQTVFENIQYSPTGSYTPRSCKPIMPEDDLLNTTSVKTFWDLASGFTFPSAKNTATVERDFEFNRAAVSSFTASTCSFTYSHNAVDVDVTDDATITKIPFYVESDLNQTLIGGDRFYIASTRDNHLKNLELYVADETSTFTATNGIVMQYTAINASTNRPDYATCGCTCTASELFQDDLISISSFSGLCAKYHRWMEFTDGTDTWYVQWFTSYPHDTSDWEFLFRRASDCKEISFTGVSNALPSSTGSVTKTGSNSNSDTMSIDVLT